LSNIYHVLIDKIDNNIKLIAINLKKRFSKPLTLKEWLGSGLYKTTKNYLQMYKSKKMISPLQKEILN